MRHLEQRTRSAARSLAALAVLLGVWALWLMPGWALADDCHLDRDDDGRVDRGSIDNDGDADSGGDDSRLACGVGALANAPRSTAVGGNSFALGERAVAMGSFAQATAYYATAVGDEARALNTNTTALGGAALADGALSADIGFSPRDFDEFQPHQVRKKRAIAARLRGLASVGHPVFSHAHLRISDLDASRAEDEEGAATRVRSGRFSETLSKET